jgi:hypothetical protein
MKNSGLSFCELLTVVFVILKLCNIIKWSWIWVLSPLWISLLLYFLIIGIFYRRINR